jgi:hypothetical protein
MVVEMLDIVLSSPAEARRRRGLQKTENGFLCASASPRESKDLKLMTLIYD